MNKQNQWMESGLERSCHCHNDGMQSMYAADEPTNEECKQFSDHYAKMGGQNEACINRKFEEINQKFEEIDQKFDGCEDKVQKIKHKEQSDKKYNHETRKQQRKIIKAMTGELDLLQKRQKQLEGKVKLLENIIICIACMAGCAAPQDTLKDVHRECKSLYKGLHRKKTKKEPTGIESYIDASYKDLD